MGTSTSFLSNINGDSWIHRLDPRAKLALLGAYTICPLLFVDPAYVSVFVVLIAPLWATARLNWRSMVGPLVSIGMLVFFVVVFNCFWGTGRTAETTAAVYQGYRVLFKIGPLSVSNLSLQRSLFLGLRLVVPLSTGLLLVSTTDPSLLAKGLRKSGVPTSICFLLLVGLRFIPIVFDQLYNISDAMTIRGVAGKGFGGFARRSRLLLLPLFLTSLRRTRVTGVACECKGYGSGSWRTFLEEFKLSGRDKAVVVISLFLLVASFWVRFGLGLGWSAIGNF